MVEEEHPLILSEIIKPIISDIQDFISEISLIDHSLSEVREPLRKKFLAEGRLLSADPCDEVEDLQAVDSASVSLNREGIGIVMALGVCVGERMKCKYLRKTGPNCPEFSQLTTALRLSIEFDLLKDAEALTIVDNSFWSILMESNKVMTVYRGLESGTIKSAFKEAVDVCFSKNGTFLQTLSNPNLVGISKTASSDSLAKKEGLYPLIPDRVLATAILREGEYLRPMTLKDGTSGNFGIERGIDGVQEIEAIYKGQHPHRVMVTYYRPWSFQRAYRIEFHGEKFPNPEALSRLLASVKHQTRIQTIMEPLNQFIADKICKQIKAAIPLYDTAAIKKYAHLMGKYRT